MFAKTFKKVISMVVIAAFILSLVPVVGMAETSSSIAYDKATVYTENTSHQSLSTYGMRVQGGRRYSYVKIDLSDYLKILEEDGTSINMTWNNRTGKSKFGRTFAAYGMNPKGDFYNASTLVYEAGDSETLESTDDYGLRDFNSTYKLGENIQDNVNKDTESTINGGTMVFDKNVILKMLDEDTTNSIITVGFTNDGMSSDTEVSLYNGTDITVTYDADKPVPSDGKYLNKIKEEMTWEKLFKEVPSDGITPEVSLQSSYKGVNIEWSSEPNVISEDNKFIQKVGKAVPAKLTGKLSYGTADTTGDDLEFDIVVIGDEPSIAEVAWQNRGNTRGADADGVQPSNVNRPVRIDTGNTRIGYAQFDLKPYAKLLESESTSLSLEFTHNDPTSSYPFYGMDLYIMSDAVDNYDMSKLTHNIAEKKGLQDKDNGKQILHYYNDGTAFPQTAISVPLSKEDLNTYLTTEDCILTFTFFPVHSASSYLVSGKLKIAYDPAETPTDDEYLAGKKTEMDWDALFPGVSKDNVTADAVLPAEYRGIDIAWSADPDVINDDGTIFHKRGEAVTATLTANPTIGTATTDVIEFTDVIIAKETPVTIKIRRDIAGHIRARFADTNHIENYRAFYMTNDGMNQILEDSRGDEQVFMRWDLAEYRNIIDAAQSITLCIPSMDTYGEKNGIVTLLNDAHDTWAPDTIIYNDAIASGMYSDPGIMSIYGIEFPVIEGGITIRINDAQLLPGIKEALAQSSENSQITFRFSSASSTTCKIQLITDNVPYLEVSYYESEVKDTIATPALTWSAITNQEQNNVVADLILPDTWYGKTLTWSASGSGVADDGTVIIAEAEQQATLTAMSDSEMVAQFTINIPANGIAVKSQITYDNTPKYNCSSGYVFSNADEVSIVDIIQATYNGDTLVAIKVIEDFDLASGQNYIAPTNYSQTGMSSLKTKIIIVDDMSTLTPLAIAK